MGLNCVLPARFGGATLAPAWVLSHCAQLGHQLPGISCAESSQECNLAGNARFVFTQ